MDTKVLNIIINLAKNYGSVSHELEYMLNNEYSIETVREEKKELQEMIDNLLKQIITYETFLENLEEKLKEKNEPYIEDMIKTLKSMLEVFKADKEEIPF